jgi:hypothetical protein
MAQGTIQAEQKAQGSLAQLQSQDNAQRLQMISLAQSGADIGNAATQTADALRANLGSAMAGQTANSVGDVFGDLSKNVDRFQTAAMTRKGINAANQNIYGSQSTTATGKGPFG